MKTSLKQILYSILGLAFLIGFGACTPAENQNNESPFNGTGIIP